MLQKSDTKWNKIIAHESKRWLKFVLILWNPSVEKYWADRTLGYYKDGKIFVTRKRDKHLFRKNNSYGFNHNWLKWILAEYGDCQVIVSEGKGKPKLTANVATILDNGSFLQYSQMGYELQVFYPLDYFTKL